jgi:ribosomal protein S18 acetylase RimI-like enzyme
MSRAIEWAKHQNFPGITLETQDNNVPACKFYEKCGFVLGGFDLYAFRNLSNASEIALYWYLIF